MFDLSFANSTGSRMLALLVSLAATPLLAQSQYNISVLYTFTGSAFTGNDLEGPGASLIADAKGNFYGTATNGSGGGVFELSPPSNGSGPWTETVLYAFQDGADGGTPLGSLLLDSAGTLYGTASAGGSSSTFCGNYTGCGVVFKLSPSSGGTGPWTESVLYTFTGGADGLAPSGNLAFDSKGNLYGATTYGGLSTICAASQQLPGCGVVFELSPPAGGSGPWSEQVTYTFKGGADGGYPFNLTIDSTGNLYGGAILGGDTSACSAAGCGVIFELTPAGGGGPWTEAVLHTFTGSPSDGANPIGTLAFGSNGSLYGTTFSGGTGTACSPGLSIGLAAGCGTVFQLTPSGNSSWSEALLHNFIGTDLASPYAGVILDAAGNLYGTALSGTTAATAVGGIFEISLSSGTWTENVLHAFNQSDGTDPYGGLTFDSKGNILGTTAYGGDLTGPNCTSSLGFPAGCGVFFELYPTRGATTSTSLTLSPASVAVGSKGPVVMTATVSQASGTGTPTGFVLFSQGATGLGTAALNGGTATFNFDPSNLTPLSYTITATYSGNSTFAGSSSAPQTLSVVANLVPTPKFSPASESTCSSPTVAISDATQGASIYYTTDGSAPTTSSHLYSAPITIALPTTLNAIASLNGNASSVGTATYTMSPAAPVPTLSPVAGTYTSTQTVTLSDATGGAVIYYTTDGSVPISTSNVYSAPLTVSSTETINAIATAPGFCTSSATATATYTIEAPFTIASATGSSSTATVSPGGTATYALSVTPVNGTFPAAISFSVSGLPAGATATFSPVSIAGGAGATAVTLSVKTSAATAKVNTNRMGWPVALGTLLIPFLGIYRWLKRDVRDTGPGLLCLCVLLYAGGATGLVACGGGSSTSRGGGGATPQTYTITVTATSGQAKQTTTVTLSVD